MNNFMKLSIGEICEKVDILCHLEDIFKSGKPIDDVDREHAAEFLSEYADILLGIEIEI